MPDPVAFELAKDPAFVELKNTMNEVGRLVRGVVTIVQQQGTALTQMRTDMTKLSPGSGTDKDDAEDDVDEPDLDTMTNGDFQKLMMKQIGTLLDDKLKGVSTKLDGTLTEFRNSKLTEEFENLKGKHKDFGDWGDEMQALAKENPGLTLPRLYALVRAENPAKAKELDAKYAEKKDEGANGGLSLFGGFRPALGKTGGGDGKGAEKMTADQAANKAWDDAIAQFPGLKSLETEGLD